MSAYIVDAKKISAIATAVAGDAHQLLALRMCAENINSIAARYPDIKGKEVESFLNCKEQDWLEDSLVFNEEKHQANEIADMIGSYCYQACEHEGWSTCGLPEQLYKARDEFKEKAKIEEREQALNSAVESERLRAIGQQILIEKKPDWASHAITATLKQSKTDIQSDYYGSSTVRVIVLAWSKHGRNLFPEMRKAAKNCQLTAHMAKSGKEHRENYSMGRGMYLSENGGYYASEWEIRKVPVSHIDARYIGESKENYCAG